MGSGESADKEQLSSEAAFGELDAEEVRHLLFDIIQMVVDHPDDVELNHVKGENTHVFTVRVVKSDVGKVIGKQGKMINSIRTILNGIAAKHRSRAVIDVDEP